MSDSASISNMQPAFPVALRVRRIEESALVLLDEETSTGSPSLSAATWRSASGCWLALGGRLDHATAAAVLDAFKAVPGDTTATTVLLDLRDVHHVDLTGLRALQRCRRDLARHGIVVTVVAASGTTLSALGDPPVAAVSDPWRRGRAYCGPAHHRSWLIPGDDDAPSAVYLFPENSTYRLALNPRTGNPARDHRGSLVYVDSS